jgi:tRNA A-37 threonylcarbamoyl transferase component Bud32
MGQGVPRGNENGAANLAGRYRLIAELGQGGMATVYLAVALGTSGFRKLAVVKLLRPEIAIDDEFVQMFLDEARLCARLSHPNIVQTYDVGVDEVGHVMAMEYLDGVSLHAAVAKLARNAGPLKFPLHAKVLLEVLEGLQYAHELADYDGRPLHIVHRDVTPHNIFVTYDGQVKLLDFGIAKASTSSVRTATGVVKGKLTYMAPEQARGESVDARADVYAVGVMLWEAVTGRRRWPTGLSQPALFTRLAAGVRPESPNAASLGYPAELDEVVLRSLAPKPEDRYQTAGALRDALDPIVRGLEPASLRELGGMLANAFAEGRQRLRDVVEERFRAIDAGGHPSEPHLLPALIPLGVTASQSMQLPLPPAAQESPSSRLTSAALSRSTVSPSPLRTRLAIGVVASVLSATALAVAFAGHRSRSAATTEPVNAQLVTRDPVGTATLSSPRLTDSAPNITASDESRSAVSNEPSEPPRRSDGRNRAGWVSLPVATRTPVVHPGPATRDLPPVAPPPMPSTATSAETSTGASLPTRSPPSRPPKVQLERENPYPGTP